MSIPISISSLGGAVLQFKELSPNEWEGLESLPEDIRAVALVRSSIENAEDMYIKVGRVIRGDFIHAFFEGDFGPYNYKVQTIYNEILDACYKANCMIGTKFKDEEDCEALTITLVDGKLVSRRKKD